MTREELEKRHSLYNESISDWNFFIRSYMGGSAYKNGNYLLKHPFESTVNYDRRKESAYYYNYCSPIVDIFTSHLFKKGAKRNFGTLGEDELFHYFIYDSDLRGSSFSQFMRDASRYASVYGSVSFIIDKPGKEVITKAEAIEADIRPYVTMLTPENILDWSFERGVDGRERLTMVKIYEGSGRYRVWTDDDWHLWQVVGNNADSDSDGVLLIDSGEHLLGQVPLVTLYNKSTGINFKGISDLEDIADINRNIYYLCSDAKEIIENTAFPMLAMPYSKLTGDDEVEAGPKNIIQFDPEHDGAKPYWLEAPHSSLSEIREWVRQDINEIHRIAKMGGARGTETSKQARSGIALELEYQQLHAILSEKADNIEQAEREILKLWAMWEGKIFDGFIDYPDDFSVRDLASDLDRSLKAKDVKVSSVTFDKELQKNIVDAVLPKLTDEVRRKISEEIESGL